METDFPSMELGDLKGPKPNLKCEGVSTGVSKSRREFLIGFAALGFCLSGYIQASLMIGGAFGVYSTHL